MMVPVDALDDAILARLRRDARAPYTAIAEAVDASEATVRNRVKALVEDGVIRQFTIRERGSNIRAVVEVRVTTNVHAGEVGQAVLALPGVQEVWELTGEWDLAALVNVDTTEELNEVVDGIRRIETTEATRTRVILQERYTTQGENGT